jgi:uncharacterized protein (TIGR02611 family)
MAKLSVSEENAQVRAAGGAGDSADSEESDNGGKDIGMVKHGRLDTLLQSTRRTPAGRLGLKIGVGVSGAIVVGGGLVLVPLPGPGWLIVFAGIAIWSIEFRWARRLNQYVQARVSAWTRWYAQQDWPVRILLGVVLFILVIAAISAATYLSFGAAPFRRLGF